MSFSVTDFKTSLCTVLRKKYKFENLCSTQKTLLYDLANVKKIQRELTEIGSTIIKMTNTRDKINMLLDTAEGRISKLEENLEEIMQNVP